MPSDTHRMSGTIVSKIQPSEIDHEIFALMS